MHNIDQDPLGSQKLIQDAALLVTHLEAVGKSGDQAKLMLQGLGLTTDQVDKAMAQANASATGTATALNGVGTGAASSIQWLPPLPEHYRACFLSLELWKM